MKIKIVWVKFKIIVNNEQKKCTGNNKIKDLTHGGLEFRREYSTNF